MSAQEKISRIVLAEDEARGACIKVVGVGGGGGNAISRMMEAGLNGVEFIAVNTDLQALRANRAPVKIQIGGKITKGLGAGANPDIGREAAIEDTEKLVDALEGADMVFIAAGLGGGTGTGAAPVVASITSQLGGGDNSNLLTVAVVTLPFKLEGKKRLDQAMDGLMRLRESVDSVIVIPNDRLRETVARQTPISEAFRMADDVVRQAVQGISDIITIPGLVNLDFADVRAVMKSMGAAVMGTGIAEGENRAIEAARRAIENPLLDDSSIQGARGVIVNITGGPDMSLDEASEATEFITREADPEANVIYGIVIDEQMRDKVKVTVIATGFQRRATLPVTPTDLGNYRFGGDAAPAAAPAPTAIAPGSAYGSRDASGECAAVPAGLQSTFYRKTPQNPMAPPTAPGPDTSNLDVPAFLRKQGNG
jgi:cell division protein FtsZ